MYVIGKIIIYTSGSVFEIRINDQLGRGPQKHSEI